MFCFSGPTSQSVVEGIGQALKREMELEKVGMTRIHRVFSIFIEQMQNVVNYSLETSTLDDVDDDEGLKYGVVIVGRHEGKFYIICGEQGAPGRGREDRGAHPVPAAVGQERIERAVQAHAPGSAR